MFLFYVAVGYLSSFGIGALIDAAEPGYEEPEISPSLLTLLNAGPFEESLAFGIPFYVFGNILIVLITGVIWASIHLFNTLSIDVSHLAYGNLVFALCYLFFSLRTWISGMGWFSILAHSAFDGVAFLESCILGQSCIVSIRSDFLLIGLSFILLFIVYFQYTKRKSKLESNKIIESAAHLAGSPIFPRSEITCKNCGSQNPSNLSYCYHCGLTLANVCPNCNSMNSFDLANCSSCGHNIKIRASIFSHLVRPTRKRAGLVILISLSSLFIFPVYVSYPVIIGSMAFVIARRPRLKRTF